MLNQRMLNRNHSAQDIPWGNGCRNLGKAWLARTMLLATLGGIVLPTSRPAIAQTPTPWQQLAEPSSSVNSTDFNGMGTTPQQPNWIRQVTQLRMPVPADAPVGRTAGTGSHSSCVVGDRSGPLLWALVPQTKSSPADGSGVTWGDTSREHPTLWFRVDYPRGTQIEFSWHNAEDEHLETQFYVLDGRPSVIGFTVSEAIAPPSPPENATIRTGTPETGTISSVSARQYLWYLKVRCGDATDTPDDFVYGNLRWLPPVSSPPAPQPETRDDQLSAAAAAGLWFDWLDQILAETPTTPTAQLSSEAIALLNAVGFPVDTHDVVIRVEGAVFPVEDNP